ncbi:MAG: transcriptional repressor NrdR [Desulfobulbaceae bacterium]|nr:transcriptional repressor NrdR [Desulfobulbaceae bacterium]
MKCPYCNDLSNKVVDSRLNKEQTITRRRRLCESCGRRFTTYERLEVTMPMLIKKDGRREAWNRDKVVHGLKTACEKRPVSIARIEKFVDSLEGELQDMGEQEIATEIIGERVMAGLHKIDEIAYVRFASVYRQFRDINEFMDELKIMLGSREE